MIQFIAFIFFFVLFAQGQEVEYLGPSRNSHCVPHHPIYEAFLAEAKKHDAFSDDVWPESEMIRIRVLALSVPRYGDGSPLVATAEEAAGIFSVVNSIYEPAGVSLDLSYHPVPQLPPKYIGKIMNGPTCRAERIADGVCDCHRRDDTGDWTCCTGDLEDGGDCFDAERKASVVKDCSDGQDSNGESGNGYCDPECNFDLGNPSLSFDGGDCCAEQAPEFLPGGLACRDPSQPQSLQQRLTSESIGYKEKDFYSWLRMDGAPQWDKYPSLKILFAPGGVISWALMPSRPNPDHWFPRGLISVDRRHSAFSKIPTLVHELGHLFGLPHTFTRCNSGIGLPDGGYKYWRETKSTWEGGDFIEDTAAVPAMATSSCLFEYNYHETNTRKECPSDDFNIYYSFAEARANPYSLGNWMNYGECPRMQGHFTAGQIALMRCHANYVYHREQLVVSQVPGEELCTEEPAGTVDAPPPPPRRLPPRFPVADWVSPAIDSLHDVGDALRLQFNGMLRTYVEGLPSGTSYRIGLVRRVVANVLRCQVTEGVIVRANSKMAPWLASVIIYEGKELPDEVRLSYPEREVAAHIAAKSPGLVTKGEYVLVLEVDPPLYQQSRYPFERVFSPPFWIGYRTCAASVPDRSSSAATGREFSVVGVCRPRAECAALDEGAMEVGLCSTDGKWEGGSAVVCCVSDGRNLIESPSDVMGVAAGDLSIPLPDTYEELDSLPVSVVGDSTSQWSGSVQPPDALLRVSGAVFLGGPLLVSFDGRLMVGELRVNTRALLAELLSQRNRQAALAALPRSSWMDVPAILRVCQAEDLVESCFGRQTALPKVSLVGLELLTFGSGAPMAPVDLLALARNHPDSATAAANRAALSGGAGSIELIVPPTLPERVVYMKATFAPATGREVRFSAPFELNYAPCSVKSPLPGTCRPQASCPAPYETASDATGCEQFVSDYRCCQNDPLGVLGQYRDGTLDDVADAGNAGALPPVVIALLAGGAGLLFLVGVAGCIFMVFVRSRSHQKQHRRPGGSRRRSSAQKMHRRSRTDSVMAGGDIDVGGSRRASRSIGRPRPQSVALKSSPFV